MFTGEIPSGNGGASSSTMRNSVVIGSKSQYGGWPVSNSTSVHARDQISDGGTAPLNSITSGAIQFGVPTEVHAEKKIIIKSIAFRLYRIYICNIIYIILVNHNWGSFGNWSWNKRIYKKKKEKTYQRRMWIYLKHLIA